MSGSLDKKAAALLEICRTRGLTLATAESCTGGLIIGCLTAIAGSSEVVDRGFVTYSNTSKSEMLGVSGGLIARVGAVSADVARAMAEGALARSNADLVVAVTGIAGPGGGSAEKPVGLVHFAGARRGGAIEDLRTVFEGDRAAVRLATIDVALDFLHDLAQNDSVD